MRAKPRNAGSQPLDRRDVAAGVDDEVLDRRLRAGAGHRAVERDVPGLLQDRLERHLVVERQRAGLDDGAALRLGAGDHLGRVEHGPRRRQAGDDVAGRLGDGLRAVRDLDAGRLRLAHALGIDVEADHPPAGGHEVARERPAHDAEADDADAFCPWGLREMVRWSVVSGQWSVVRERK